MLLEDLKLNLRTARANRERAEAGVAESTSRPATGAWSRFAAWRKNRPFVGALLTMLAGVEMFFSGQLDLGNIKVQVGVAGLQSTIIPVVMVLLGILIMAMPVHRIFYGVIALAISVYSLIGLNLGGFFIGMLLGAVGGVLVVSWIPRRKAVTDADDVEVVTSSPARPAAEARPLAHSRT